MVTTIIFLAMILAGGLPMRWHLHLSCIKDVYDGIDFRVSSIGNNLKYDFIVKPGADPSQIKIEYAGVDGIEKSDDELEIRTAVGSLTEQKPFSYQVNGDNKQTVPSEYRLNDNIVSFSFPADYDECRDIGHRPALDFFNLLRLHCRQLGKYRNPW